MTTDTTDTDMEANMSAGALSDVRVVEYSLGPAGSMCGKAFADLGADVIKVEPPEGDPTRLIGPFPNDVPDPESSGLFMYLNANKRGMKLDLMREEDRRRMRDMMAGCDIFVTDVQPSDSLKLWLDSPTVAGLDPRLIRVYVTPFGNTGPYRDWKATDLIAWHMGGMGWETPAMYVTEPEAHTPLRGRGNMGMYLAGWVAAAGAMCALFHREKYGVGQEIDVSAMDAVSSHIRGNFAMYSYDISRVPETREKVFFPWIWECEDGWASATFLLDHWWRTLKGLMGNPNWADNEDYDTLPGRRDGLDVIEPGVAEWARGFERDKLYETLQSAGIPCFPVQGVDEVSVSAHYEARGFFVEQEHPTAGSVKRPGAPLRFSGTPWKLRSVAPTMGQDAGWADERVKAPPPPRVEEDDEPAPRAPARNRPLEGVRIVDFGWILSVPYAGGWLGSLGAEVVRVESNTRLEPGRSGLNGSADGIQGVNRSGIWNCLNHSKRGVTLNLRDPDAQELVRELVSVSDVVMENFSTGVLDRLGLGYDDLRKVRPDLVMISGSTMGTYGPDREASGFGPNVCSYAGQPSVTGYVGGQPQNLGGNWPDYLVGTMMVHSVLSALWHRRKTGEGQRIEAAMAEVVSAMMPEAFLDYAMNGRVAERIGNRDPNMAPHNVYRCAGEDDWVAIAVQTDEEWRGLCGVMERAELARDKRFATLKARKENEDALDEIVSEWALRRPSSEITHTLQDAGIAAGPVMDVVALMADPHFRARGTIIEMDHTEVGPREVAGLPIRFGDIPRPAYYTAPLLGEHNDAVFGGLLGHGADEVERMKESKAIF